MVSSKSALPGGGAVLRQISNLTMFGERLLVFEILERT